MISSLLFAYAMHLSIDAPHELKGNFFSGDLPYKFVYFCIIIIPIIDCLDLFGDMNLIGLIVVKSAFFMAAVVVLALYSGSFTTMGDNLFSMVLMVNDFVRGIPAAEYMIYASACFALGALMIADNALEFFANIISLFLVPLALICALCCLAVFWNIILLLLSFFLGDPGQFIANIFMASIGGIIAASLGWYGLLFSHKNNSKNY
ncbi:hypothetical protein LJB99_00035 [Deltaproteobacteria bacterium OttesenSCG-928-K17]|nr:hypothetical protein [Deltaproteobacteria bacterium OttesenSCG-928-K17]